MSYPFGQAVNLDIGPLTGQDGQPVDPTTLDVTIQLPDATQTVIHIESLTRLSTGLFRYVYLPPEFGDFAWRAVGTAPNVADEDEFTVDAPFAILDLWCSPSAVQTAPDMTGLSDVDAMTVARMATDLLNDLSGRQFGLRTGTVRPEGCGHHGDWLTDDVVGFGMALPLASFLGPWPLPGPSGGMPALAQCGGCSKWATGGIRLEGPVVWDANHPITILVDGDTLDPSRWSIIDKRIIVRTDRAIFPACQDLRVATSEPGTLAVTYSRGVPIPMGGIQAAITLAAEFAKSLGFVTGECHLPERIKTITRQGTTAVMIDPLDVIKAGGTGIVSVDLWLVAVNPKSLRRRASVHTPGMEFPQPTVFAGSAGSFG